MDDQVLEAFGVYLGETTNKVAEWTAVKLALEAVAKYKPQRVHGYMEWAVVGQPVHDQYRLQPPGSPTVDPDVRAWTRQYVGTSHVVCAAER